jgi:hypothetical protein
MKKLSIVNTVTLGNRLAVDNLTDLIGTENLINTQLYPCERGSRKYEVRQRLALHGLEEYPEFNGEAESRPSSATHSTLAGVSFVSAVSAVPFPERGRG